MATLPNVKMLNQMKKTHIEAAHMNVRPPLLMRDDGSINTVDIRPGRTIVGGIDANGNPTIQPLNHGARFDISEVNLVAEQNNIREWFMLDLFINSLEREATATEVVARSQEQARLLSSMSGQEETESHSVMIEREINLLNTIPGMLPEMPGELIEAGGEFQIEFSSPLASSQKSDEALGAMQTFQTIAAAAQFDPSIMDRFDMDAYAMVISEANGTPAKIMRGDEDVAMIRQQRAQQEQMMAAAQMAPGVAKAGLDVARTEKTMSEM